MANKNGSKWITRQKRLAIYLRDGMSCCYCNKSIEDDITLSLDHIIPRNFGGNNKANNLITACKHCNEIRQDRDLSEFVKLYHMFHGSKSITPQMTLEYIKNRLNEDLRPYVMQAKEIIEKRPQWQNALNYASNGNIKEM